MKKLALGLSIAAVAGVAFAADKVIDHNRTVTRAEAQTRAEAMFDRLDANHDGKLDPADRGAMRGKMFDRLDANHDGTISRAEFDAAKPGMEHPGMAPPGDGEHPGPAGPRAHMGGRGGRMGGMMAMMLEKADTNHDGSISKPEFVAAALQRFDAADTNHDGKLTSDERLAARKAMRAEMAGQGHSGQDHRGHGADAMPAPPAK